MKLKIIGSSQHSIREVAQIARSLNYSYTVVTSGKIYLHGDTLPHIIITEGVKNLKQREGIICVIDCDANLKETNIPIIRKNQLEKNLKSLEKIKEIQVEIHNPTIEELAQDFTTVVTKLQSSIYSLKASVRVQIQENTIEYLNGKRSLRPLKNIFEENNLLELYDLLLQQDNLKAAIKEIKTYKNPDDVVDNLAKQYNVNRFDIMYILRSYQNTSKKKKLSNAT